MEIIKHLPTAKRLLKKICKENNIDINNVYVSKYGYIETVSVLIKDVDYCTTIHNGDTYKISYVSGCFYPFICKIN